MLAPPVLQAKRAADLMAESPRIHRDLSRRRPVGPRLDLGLESSFSDAEEDEKADRFDGIFVTDAFLCLNDNATFVDAVSR